MLIQGMCNAQVTDDNVKFSFASILYTIEGSKGKITGEVPAQEYTEVDASASGSGPWQVTLGQTGPSYTADPVKVESNDALCTFWMAYPTGTNYSNGPETFVFDVDDSDS